MLYEDFVAHLTDAYEHLYDLVYLRSHPLIGILTGSDNRKENAWQLHHLLLKAIEELDPGSHAPAFSREWRRYRLMSSRFVDGISPQVVSEQLSISRRHFYREQDHAIRAVSEVLWATSLANRTPDALNTDAEPEQNGEKAELKTELKAVPPVQARQPIQLDTVLDGALSLLQAKILDRGIRIEIERPEASPFIMADRQPVRQLLLALLGYLVDRLVQSPLGIAEIVQETQVGLSLTWEQGEETIFPQFQDVGTRLTAFNELAVLCPARLELQYNRGVVTGFMVTFDAPENIPTILVVDDNEDILELFKRYLEAQHWQVISVAGAQEALQALKTVQPQAIILDLMMPDQDGWDLLQILQNQVGTASIPIVICSVLPQEELALSLGAAAFLQKPVSEQALLPILERLKQN